MDFTDKVAIVTGSSRGIGRAIALTLARRGAHVVINYIRDKPSADEDAESVVKEVQSLGRRSLAVVDDVSDYDQMEDLVKRTVEEFGRIDILVNNAGTVRDRTIKKMTKDEWDNVISVNLTGSFNSTKHALPYLIESKGKIVSVSSIVGQIGNFGQVNYAAAKAGIIGFTKTLARELARYGITVNAVAPGFIKTHLIAGIPDKVAETILERTPLGRFGRPEEVAETVVFLLSNDFITGAVVNVDGGLWGHMP